MFLKNSLEGLIDQYSQVFKEYILRNFQAIILDFLNELLKEQHTKIHALKKCFKDFKSNNCRFF